MLVRGSKASFVSGLRPEREDVFRAIVRFGGGGFTVCFVCKSHLDADLGLQVMLVESSSGTTIGDVRVAWCSLPVTPVGESPRQGHCRWRSHLKPQRSGILRITAYAKLIQMRSPPRVAGGKTECGQCRLGIREFVRNLQFRHF